ncbi:PREDICTED: zinc transporter ZIP4-like, partial [Nanorana parkeri]|uniref:zinc transporter ZIP4-like n=1 Tax=Nanorana parkeri TaxID=125878 RepID=UPI0008541CD8
MTWSILLPCIAAMLLCPAPSAQETPFRRVLDLLAPGDSSLNRSSVTALIKRLEDRVQCGNVSCEKCLTPDSLFSAVNGSSVSQLDARGFSAVSGGLLNYVADPDHFCKSEDKWPTSVLNMGGRAEEVTLRVMASILPHYMDQNTTERCLNADDILNMTSDPDHVSAEITEAVVSAVLEGSCMTLLPPREYFLNFIYKQNETLDLEELTSLMIQLKLVSEDDHDHDHEEDQDLKSDHEGRRRRRSLEDSESAHVTHWDE